MKISNPGMIQVRAAEDYEMDRILYNFTITFQTTIAVNLQEVECDPNRARAIAVETGVKLLENEIGRHVRAE